MAFCRLLTVSRLKKSSSRFTRIVVNPFNRKFRGVFDQPPFTGFRKIICCNIFCNPNPWSKGRNPVDRYFKRFLVVDPTAICLIDRTYKRNFIFIYIFENPKFLMKKPWCPVNPRLCPHTNLDVKTIIFTSQQRFLMFARFKSSAVINSFSILFCRIFRMS